MTGAFSPLDWSDEQKHQLSKLSLRGSTSCGEGLSLGTC